ncbi:MAG: hypothetical protein AB7J28_07175 [Hyphomonadaceae bacterium]
MLKPFAALATLLALSACATNASYTPRGGPGGAPAQLDLGDWRRANPSATLSQFSNIVTRRYAAGSPMSEALRDLRANDFSCTTPPRSTRGEPPAQICRRALEANGCTHTWQVHLYGGETLTRPRGLYDRACGGDGLLGGPT